jgi:hypothetical protein
VQNRKSSPAVEQGEQKNLNKSAKDAWLEAKD